MAINRSIVNLAAGIFVFMAELEGDIPIIDTCDAKSIHPIEYLNFISRVLENKKCQCGIKKSAERKVAADEKTKL